MDSDTQPIITAPPGFFAEEVTWVHHWTESLFSFKCTRDQTLRFIGRPGRGQDRGEVEPRGLVLGGSRQLPAQKRDRLQLAIKLEQRQRGQAEQCRIIRGGRQTLLGSGQRRRELALAQGFGARSA